MEDFYKSFAEAFPPKVAKIINNTMILSWITQGTKVLCEMKRISFVLSALSALTDYYKRYCKILSRVIPATRCTAKTDTLVGK